MDKSIEILKVYGLKRTKVRKKILALFLACKYSLSLSEIESSFEKLDRSTLYRILKTFEAKGIIHRAIDSTHHPKYAIGKAKCDKGYHAHFHCTYCEKTICLHQLLAPNIPNLPKEYIVQETNLTLSGTCPDCK